MAEQTVYNRQAPFIEDRSEQLLATIFGAPQIGQVGDADYQAAIQGLANTSTSIPAYEVAQLTPEQQQAANLSSTGLGAYQPFLQDSANTVSTGIATTANAVSTLDPSNISDFMDPYSSNVTQAALTELQRQGNIQAQSTASDALAAGAFGGGRFGVREAEDARNLLQVKSQRIFEDLSRNYLQAQQAQQSTASTLGALGQQQLAGAQAQAGLGAQTQSLGGVDIDRLLGIGSMQQQQSQAEIDVARRTNIAQQKEPFERVSFASDILRGVPSSQISYTQAPDPSTFQQIAGLGIAGLGALGSIGGISGLRG